jgi:hypothetical protein
VCTLGLNAEKIYLSAGAGAGDSTPEIGALTVTDPRVSDSLVRHRRGAMALMVPAHAGLEHGHALSQPRVSHHEGSQTYGVTVGPPHHRKHLRTAYTDTAPRGTTAGLRHHPRPFGNRDGGRSRDTTGSAELRASVPLNGGAETQVVWAPSLRGGCALPHGSPDRVLLDEIDWYSMSVDTAQLCHLQSFCSLTCGACQD